jgi:hypothetical protein
VRLIGIQRSSRFSPGRHADNDRSILEATAAVLRRKGCTVHLIGEDDVGAHAVDATAVFSMCQGVRANRLLEQVERQGALIINRPTATQNCYRTRLHEVLRPDWGIFAPTVLVPTSGACGPPPPERPGAGGFWIKRGDVHATQSGDVVHVHSAQEFKDVLIDFHQRGIPDAVVAPHLAGDVVKFYGVVGSSFFRFYCEHDFKVCPIDFAGARPRIEHLVRRLGLEIYGGDAVVTPEGRVRVIDINDWPSFANFRSEAAQAIGAYIHRRAVRHMSRSGPALQGAAAPLVQGSS